MDFGLLNSTTVRINTHCLTPPRLWPFVTAAAGNSHKYHEQNNTGALEDNSGGEKGQVFWKHQPRRATGTRGLRANAEKTENDTGLGRTRSWLS